MLPKKMIFTDLDGTLLGADRTVSSLNRSLIADLKNQDIWVLPATGRSYNVSRHVLPGLDFPYYICFNGCVITDQYGKILFEDALKPDLVWQIIKFCTEHNIAITAYQGEDVFYNIDKPSMAGYLERTGLDVTHKFDHPTYKATQCYKMLIPETPDVIDDIEKQILGHFGEGLFNLSGSGGGRLEIYALSSNKGQAVKWLCDYLNIDINDAVAIGDADNDVEMLKSVGYSIAMGQSSDQAEVVAQYQTDNNADNGWYNALVPFLAD